MRTRIMHVDLDAFFASVEQRRDPRLRGKPVIVGSGVIASCSYEARRFGLRAGMELHEARKRCPRVVILEGQYPVYRCFAARVFDLCRQASPDIETYLDEAYCDLSGTEGLFGHPLNAAMALKRDILRETGLTVSVGVGHNRMMAKLAGGASRPDGLRVVAEDEAEDFLSGLPVRKLPGVGHATAEALARLNIQTVGALRALPRESLRDMFGANGLILFDRCRGRDTAAASAREIPKTISRETAFHRETDAPAEVEAMLYYLVERAARTLRGLGLACRRVEARLRYSDYRGENGSETLLDAASDDARLFEAAAGIARRLWTRRASLRFVGVTLSRFQVAGQRQTGLFDQPADSRRNRLCACLDELRSRFGHSAVVAGKSLELLGKLRQDSYGYVLRTPCLTK